MHQLIIKNIQGKKVLFLFILTNLVYSIMLTVTIPKLMQFTDGLKILDMLPFGYNTEYVNTLLDVLGEDGRSAYLYQQIPIDMIYPILFGISYCLMLAYFLQKLDKLEGIYFYFCYLPLLAGIFDYFENIGIITMLSNYPDLSNLLVVVTNIFTILKSISTTIYFLILILTIILSGIRTIRIQIVRSTS